MKITQGTKVKITGQPGAADKWPRFFRGFGGRSGVVVGVAPAGKWGPEMVVVNMSRESDPVGFINVSREWLTQIGVQA